MRVHGSVHVCHLHKGLEAGALVEHDDLVDLPEPTKDLLESHDGHLRAYTEAKTKGTEKKLKIKRC